MPITSPTPTNTGKAYVFRSSSGDVYYVDQADENGAQMDEALFSFSECPDVGLYSETFRLDSAATPAVALGWINEGIDGVAAQDGVDGDRVTIPSGYRVIDLRVLNAVGILEVYNPSIGGIGAGRGYVPTGAGIALLQADVDERIVGDLSLVVTGGMIVEITIGREV